ncbi:VPLPA-CTERM protein sorting domain-containing protein [Albimonas pacifica]|uniref:VPLPA-CTERM protein sorting domain-containing protein n=2 Tax=Albimonas pacifica TaxID=1114924 RepID=A0A1I3EKU9_9RHOB|nr:VPLPA-CTERM protein sorting domain-containing protein [Albimonas pacifica]
MRSILMGIVALLGLFPLAAGAVSISDYTILIPDGVNSGPGYEEGGVVYFEDRWVDVCAATCNDGAVITWDLVNDTASPYAISVTGYAQNAGGGNPEFLNFFMYAGNADTYAASTLRWVLLPTSGSAGNVMAPQQTSPAVTLIIPAMTTYYVVASYDTAKAADFVEVAITGATPIPLPAALPLLGAGLAGLALTARGRRRG